MPTNSNASPININKTLISVEHPLFLLLIGLPSATDIHVLRGLVLTEGANVGADVSMTAVLPSFPSGEAIRVAGLECSIHTLGINIYITLELKEF